MSQSLESYLFLSAALFSIGVYGLLARRNLVAILISLELILNSASINFLAFNKFCLADKAVGQVFAVFVIALAAAEVCIGLSLILLLYRKRGSINVDEAGELKG
ncbi:MAG TPA: NADH-quinone oxidoreductase subunit NuoK [Candidatus Eisenbacteria bacterium]|jgi:NADH:ubiquinone oxidoreductase subunit K|nr:NADH-quinone oxidoreductase subunit NuoK [Candidatus Eisenbacteria bacterium]